jgi:hypothetical protein
MRVCGVCYGGGGGGGWGTVMGACVMGPSTFSANASACFLCTPCVCVWWSCAAISLNQGEVVRINIGQSPFAHPPTAPYMAVFASRGASFSYGGAADVGAAAFDSSSDESEESDPPVAAVTTAKEASPEQKRRRVAAVGEGGGGSASAATGVGAADGPSAGPAPAVVVAPPSAEEPSPPRAPSVDMAAVEVRVLLPSLCPALVSEGAGAYFADVRHIGMQPFAGDPLRVSACAFVLCSPWTSWQLWVWNNSRWS